MTCAICRRGKNTEPSSKTVRVRDLGDIRVQLCDECHGDQHRVRALMTGAVRRARGGAA